MAVMYLDGVDAELAYLKSNECDILYRAFVSAVSRNIRAQQLASSSDTVVRSDGSPADLLRNGFLLGGTDIAFIQAASAEGTSVTLQRRARAFRKKAIDCATSAAPPIGRRPTVAKKLKCAYWLTKAAVLLHAHESAVPVSPRDLEVWIPPVLMIRGFAHASPGRRSLACARSQTASRHSVILSSSPGQGRPGH